MGRLVYVAGASAELERAESAIRRARAQGLVVTYDWPISFRAAQATGGDDSLGRADRYRVACEDRDGVLRARALWLLAPRRGSTGAGFELGLAYAWGKHVVVSGENRHLFASLAHVEVDRDEEAISQLLAYFETEDRKGAR